MTFREWQLLTPRQAARQIHARVLQTLAPGQQRAAIALLVPEDELVVRFDAAPRHTPLGGVPFFAKDLFDAAGTPTLAGSTFLNQVRPDPKQDGAFVRALRTAGAVLVGKTQMHEFAYGVTGDRKSVV